jgi:uncharacterized damage-inducible protein DinB
MSDPKRNPPPPLPASTLLRLKTQLDSLERILQDASADALDRRPPDGKWSAREHVAHLGRYHEVFLERLDRMLGEDAPRLGRYRAEDDPGAEPWFRLPAPEALDRMRALRARLIERVAALGPEQLRRTGVHPAFGEMSVALWIEFFLAHEGHHFYAAFQRVRERAG